MNDGFQKLVKKIDGDITASPTADGFSTVDLFDLVKSTAIDVVCEICFGESLNVLEQDPYSVRATVDTFFEATSKVSSCKRNSSLITCL